MTLLYIIIPLFIIYSLLIIYYWLIWKSIPAYTATISSPQTSISVNGLYAYELKINKRLVARAGLSAGFTQRSLDYSGLLFSDQIANGGGPSSSALGNGTKVLSFANE